MSNPRRLPLFPLDTVLFPGMVLPLHIFEPRCRLMIGRCLELNQPFGVVLIKEGAEVGGTAIPHHVGTSAYITHVDREKDGRMNIQSVGYQRFRLLEMEQKTPYMVGMVEDFPVAEAEAPSNIPLVEQIRPVLRYYLDVLRRETDLALDLDEIPNDGLALAYFIAITLPLPMEERQTLLQEATLGGILSKEQGLLRREVAPLDHMRQQPPLGTNENLPFSSN